MHKNATKCNKTLSKWCKNKHGASKIIDTLEMYQHQRLNYSSMSMSYPPGGASLRVHLEATLQPARRIIARLLREDATFFREHHYLDPLGVDDSDNPML
jgi:hypothetical protein